MNLLRYTSIIFSIFLYSFAGIAQKMPNYSKAVIYFDGKSVSELAILGIDISHGELIKGFSFESDFSEYELYEIEQAGFQFDIIEPNAGKYYLESVASNESAHSHQRTNSFCPDGSCFYYPKQDPTNFKLGTMRGFFRLQEIQEELYKMHFFYPHLISEETPLGDFRTHEGRGLSFFKITTNPENEHPERPKVLHTALHHAREGITVSQMIYYMWYLLENYEHDENIKYILDNSELYFVPVVNPDGYLFNERHFFSGSGELGLHRGNMRRTVTPEGDTFFGVDLNRNYGFNFALNNVGSSNNPRIETFRGPFEFSEPETQAIKWLCERVPFKIAINHHSFGEFVIVPFGDNVTPNQQYEEFYNMGRNMTQCNNYKVGENLELLAYETNGSSDDWMFGDVLSKNPIYAFTPEIGHAGHGFWPAQSEILPLCRNMISMNLYSCMAALNYGTLKDMTSAFHHENTTEILALVEKKSLGEGSFIVRMEPLNQSIISGTEEKIINLDAFHSKQVKFNIQLRPDISHNESTEIKYAIHLDNGHFIISDTTIAYYMGPKNILFEETFFSMNNWVPNGVSTWGLDESEFYTQFTCISDSPNTPYQGNTTNTIESRNPIFIPENAEEVYITFKAKWEIDYSNDYVQLSISNNGLTGWTPVCGSFTSNNSRSIIETTPGYSGFQQEWVNEFIPINEYKGGNIYLRWRMVSSERNNPRNYRGFFFDDLKIISTSEIETATTEAKASETILKVWPNPSSGNINFTWMGLDQYSNSSVDIKISDTYGKAVYNNRMSVSELNNLQTNILVPGIYFYQIGSKTTGFQYGKIVVQ